MTGPTGNQLINWLYRHHTTYIRFQCVFFSQKEKYLAIPALLFRSEIHCVRSAHYCLNPKISLPSPPLWIFNLTIIFRHELGKKSNGNMNLSANA